MEAGVVRWILLGVFALAHFSTVESRCKKQLKETNANIKYLLEKVYVLTDHSLRIEQCLRKIKWKLDVIMGKLGKDDCLIGSPLKANDGFNKTCAGIAGLPCPFGYKCTGVANHSDAAGFCCIDENVCDGRGKPLVNPRTDNPWKCGGKMGLSCPGNLQCVTDPNIVDSFGLCCP